MRIATDIHTHTLFSRHAYSTIAENVAAAKAAGLELLGSADHFSEMLFPEQHIRNFQFFINQGVWPRTWDGVVVLRGCEADIVSLQGALFGQDVPVTESIVRHRYPTDRSLFDRVTDGLDYVIASVHNGDFAAGASLAQTTAMYCRALEQPHVFALGHPGRAGIPFDADEVLLCARERGKAVEINNHTLEGGGRRHDACRRLAERAAELGVGIIVSSDAHIAMDIGAFPHAEGLLEEIHFPEELIVNRDRSTLLTAMARAGVCDIAL